jgi:hypothetical protein
MASGKFHGLMQAMQLQRIGFAGGAFQRFGLGEMAVGQKGVVAAKIGGLAHFADGIGPSLARLIDRNGHQHVAIGFQRVGHGAQDDGACSATAGVPVLLCGFCRRKSGGNLFVGGVGNGDGRVFHRRQPRAFGGDGNVHALTVQPVAIQVARQGNARMRARLHFHKRDGIARHQLGRGLVVQQQMHEAGIGAILQQAAHQIGQQVFVGTYRSIGAQAQRPEALFGGVIQGIAHTVQALVLDADVARHQPHRRQGVGIVGGELGIEMRRGSNQRLGADQIGQVGGGLGGVDRIARAT